MSYPGVEETNKFLKHYLADTPLAHNTPFEYILQFLEIADPGNGEHEEIYKQFWSAAGADVEQEYKNFVDPNQRKVIAPRRPATRSTAGEQSETGAAPRLQGAGIRKLRAPRRKHGHVPTLEELHAEEAKLQKDIELIRAGLWKVDIREGDEDDQTEPGAAVSDALSKSLENLKKRLETNQQGLRAKIIARDGKLGGIAAKAERFQGEALARLTTF